MHNSIAKPENELMRTEREHILQHNASITTIKEMLQIAGKHGKEHAHPMIKIMLIMLPY